MSMCISGYNNVWSFVGCFFIVFVGYFYFFILQEVFFIFDSCDFIFMEQKIDVFVYVVGYVVVMVDYVIKVGFCVFYLDVVIFGMLDVFKYLCIFK